MGARDPLDVKIDALSDEARKVLSGIRGIHLTWPYVVPYDNETHPVPPSIAELVKAGFIELRSHDQAEAKFAVTNSGIYAHLRINSGIYAHLKATANRFAIDPAAMAHPLWGMFA